MKKKKPYKFAVTKQEVDDFIANWLNIEHQNYPVFAKGVKLFIKYLEEKFNSN